MKKKQAKSGNLVDWIYWMAMDILLSLSWGIEYRYCYFDKKNNAIIARRRPVGRADSRRYQRLDACMIPDDNMIYISPTAEDKALCLFHECMEILFSDWKDEYFVPRRWGLTNGDDPIDNLESATWNHFTGEQKSAIEYFLPKEP